MKSTATKNSTASRSTQLLIEGLSALLDKQTERGADLLAQSATENSDQYEAYYFLGKLQADKGNTAKAKRIYQDLLRRPLLPSAFRLQVETALVDVYKQAGEFVAARKLAQERVNKLPEEALYRAEYCSILEALKEWSEAEVQYIKYTQLTRKKPDVRLALYQVEQAIEATDTKDKQEFLKKAFKYHPNCAAAWIVQARLYISEKKITQALEAWEQIFSTSPERSPWIFREMEDLLFESGRLDEAVDIYKELCHQKGPHVAYANIALARYYIKKQDHTLALEHLQEARAELPGLKIDFTELLDFYTHSINEAGGKRKLHHFVLQVLGQQSFTCRTCGHTKNENLWHCEKCGSWDSYTP